MIKNEIKLLFYSSNLLSFIYSAQTYLFYKYLQKNTQTIYMDICENQ